jgi:iron-sulfur cluster assembly accessory protein
VAICYNVFGFIDARFASVRDPQEDSEMVQLTPTAVTKVKEILSQQTPEPAGLRVAVVGGGCSGFSYHMAFENQVNKDSDNVYEFEGLKVLVDQMSEMYLEGVSIDYIETLEGSGFKFNNPNVKSTCGCGSSFTV